MHISSYSHTLEKLTNAIKILATDPGDARKRTAHAFLELSSVQTRDFPPDLQNDWELLERQMTKCDPLLNHKGEVWRGSVENTMSRVRNSTAASLAKKIWDLYWALTENKLYR
jgi:hypothetical protein